MAEIRNKDETSKPSNHSGREQISKPSNHSGREQKQNYKQHYKNVNL